MRRNSPSLALPRYRDTRGSRFPDSVRHVIFSQKVCQSTSVSVWQKLRGTMKTRTANWLQEATRLLDLGLAVIPLHGPDLPTPTDIDQRSIGKRPLIRWQAYQERLPSIQEVREWGRQWPRANLGVVTGAISGVIVLDSDGQQGADTLQGLGPIPRTWRVSTGH